MNTTLPRISDPILIRDQDGKTYLSRVEDVTQSALTVARPFDLPASDPIGPGTELQVTWLSTRGTAVLPVRLVRNFLQGRVQLWSVAVLGNAWFEQRRAYVRVGAAGPMTLLVGREDAASDVISARLIDVSEASLRCLISVEADADNAEVVCKFRLRDADFEIPGRSTIREQADTPEGRAELIVLFDQPVRQADALRRRVFAQEIQQRRL